MHIPSSPPAHFLISHLTAPHSPSPFPCARLLLTSGHLSMMFAHLAPPASPPSPLHTVQGSGFCFQFELHLLKGAVPTSQAMAAPSILPPHTLSISHSFLSDRELQRDLGPLHLQLYPQYPAPCLAHSRCSRTICQMSEWQPKIWFCLITTASSLRNGTCPSCAWAFISCINIHWALARS